MPELLSAPKHTAAYRRSNSNCGHHSSLFRKCGIGCLGEDVTRMYVQYQWQRGHRAGRQRSVSPVDFRVVFDNRDAAVPSGDWPASGRHEGLRAGEVGSGADGHIRTSLCSVRTTLYLANLKKQAHTENVANACIDSPR